MDLDILDVFCCFFFLKQSKMLRFSKLQNRLLLCLEVLASFRWPVAPTSFFFLYLFLDLHYNIFTSVCSLVVFHFYSDTGTKQPQKHVHPRRPDMCLCLGGAMCLCTGWKLVLFVTREDLRAFGITLQKRCWLHPEVLSMLSPEK